MLKRLYRTIATATLAAGLLLAASSTYAKDTKTEEPVFDFSSSFVSPQDSSNPAFYIWKINRIDGSLYLCQSTGSIARCSQVAGPNGEIGPFTLSDAVNTARTVTGFYVWRLNRWTGTQELCVLSGTQNGCSK